MSRSFAPTLVTALLLGLGSCASTPVPPKQAEAALARAADAIPTRLLQGSLLRARVAPGTRVQLQSADATRELRVGKDGGFALAAGRDEAGPLVLLLTSPDGATTTHRIVVDKREWQLERIQGVPESTVNPPPEIAARIEREQALVSAARERDDERDDYEQDFQWPLQGRVSGVFGSQRIYNGTPKSPHSGLDVAAAQGTPVHAPAGGIVTLAEPDLYLTGGTVLLDHGHGVNSSFLHFSRIDVKVGQRVEQGDVLGLVGMTGRATGPHMHWGLSWFGVRVDPRLLLPEPILPATPSTGAGPSQ
jgi:murein DD-endopeptidase MepM/ murein hydrolase activator NlpD